MSMTAAAMPPAMRAAFAHSRSLALAAFVQALCRQRNPRHAKGRTALAHTVAMPATLGTAYAVPMLSAETMLEHTFLPMRRAVCTVQSFVE